MATIRRRNNRYQVQIRTLGTKSISKTFIKRADALSWAKKVEIEIEGGLFRSMADSRSVTLGSLFDRYIEEAIPLLKSPKSEINRTNLMKGRMQHMFATAVTSEYLATFRDKRLREVSPQTVKHEVNLVRRVLKLAVAEWGLCLPHGVPFIRSPKLPKGREKRLGSTQEAALLGCLNSPIKQVFQFALETAMRRGEIMNMHFEDIMFDKSLLRIPETKTSTPRVIPLSKKALEILGERQENCNQPFPLNPDYVSQAFRKACKQLEIEDLHFHDLRHEAISRLFEKGLSVAQVATISGHQDYRMLARYTHLEVEGMVSLLD